MREIPGAPGYLVTANGEVYSTRQSATPRKLRTSSGNDGYPSVQVYFGRRIGRHERVHRLVALAFHGPPPTPAHEVRHLNGIRTDNRAENLAWGTRQENSLDTVRHGRQWTHVHPERVPRGEQSHNHVLTDSLVVEIRNLAADGVNDCEISRRLHVARSLVYYTRSGATWRHVGGPITPRGKGVRGVPSVVPPEDVPGLLARRAAGATLKKLAAEYGIHHVSMLRLLRRAAARANNDHPPSRSGRISLGAAVVILVWLVTLGMLISWALAREPICVVDSLDNPRPCVIHGGN